jgi:hypothetical protein
MKRKPTISFAGNGNLEIHCEPHSWIQKVAKRLKTIMDKRQSQDQGNFEK